MFSSSALFCELQIVCHPSLLIAVFLLGFAFNAYSVLARKSAAPPVTTEGSVSDFLIQLSEAPQDPVAVIISSIDNSSAVWPSQLVFNTSNWGVPQDLKVTYKRDYKVLDSPYNSMLEITVNSTDSNYAWHGLSMPFQYLVQNIDQGMYVWE